MWPLLAFIAGFAVAGLSGAVLVWKVLLRTNTHRLLLHNNHHQQIQELSQLTGGLAHEIKNPLSIIKVNLKLISEDTEIEQFQRLLRKIEVVTKETDRLEKTLDSFLKYIGKTELQLTKANINKLLDEMVDFYNPQAQSSDITIRFAPGKEDLNCNLDEAMIKQVVLNLFINAQHAMIGPGELIIRTSKRKSMAVLEISDTGCGIAAEKIDKIFDAFYTSKKGGSGLGLATAQKIILAHKGRISVNSEPGRGTSFIIELPLAK